MEAVLTTALMDLAERQSALPLLKSWRARREPKLRVTLEAVSVAGSAEEVPTEMVALYSAVMELKEPPETREVWRLSQRRLAERVASVWRVPSQTLVLPV